MILLLFVKTRFEPIISFLDCSNQKSIVIILTLVFAITAVCSSIIRLVNLRFTGWLSATIGGDLGSKCYKNYLYQNYSVHKQSNSNDATTVLTKYISSTTSALNSALNLIAALIISLFLISALLFVDPVIAIILAGIFLVAYLVLAFFSRRELYANGKVIKELSAYQLKFLRESFGSIRDIIIDNNFNFFVKEYSRIDYKLKRKSAKNGYLSYFPRYSMESIGLVCISILGAFFTINNNNDRPVIPILGTVALGAQRLLPVSQQIYTSWASLKGNKPSIQEVVSMLSLCPYIPASNHSNTSIKLKHNIQLKDLSFKYDNSDHFSIQSLNLTINKGDRLGIIGPSGSGKSTLLDLILGLLKADEGSYEVDGFNLYDQNYSDALMSWRKNISHVPQKVFLSDTSFSQNIALGIHPSRINSELLEYAARQANIYEYIMSTKYGFDTLVGESGSALSGGQQQRIGIARAFYKNSDIIVLDEATSSLDMQTESSIMSTLKSHSTSKTLIDLAHRQSTIRGCSKIIKLQDVNINASGPPEVMLST